MKAFYMAAVENCGEYLEVKYLTSSLMKDFESREMFVGLGSYAANVIKEAMDNGKNVKIISSYKDVDVQAHDLIVEELDSLSFKKEICLREIRQFVTHQQSNVSGLMQYEYININNELMSKGYFIYDDNKEEEYLKILETGDEKLIEKLERYLNARDVISRASFLENHYSKIFREIKDAEDENEIAKLKEEFMKLLNSFVK